MAANDEEQQAVARVRARVEEIWAGIDDEVKLPLAAAAANVIAPGIQQTVVHYTELLQESLGLDYEQAQVAAWWAVEQAALRAAAACAHGRQQSAAEFLTSAREAFHGLRAKLITDAADVTTSMPFHEQPVTDAADAEIKLAKAEPDAGKLVNWSGVLCR